MKKWSFLLGVVSLLFVSCANNQPEIHETESFHYVRMNGRRTRTHVVLTQTRDVYQVGITGAHKDNVVMKVRNDTLIIDMPRERKSRYDISIFTPELRSFDGVLLKELVSADTLRQDSIAFYYTDAEKTDLKLQVNKLAFYHLTKGKVLLSGQCDTAYIGAEYSYKLTLQAKTMETKDLHLYAGESKFEFNVTDHLWIHKAWLSKINYVGEPQIMECNMKWSKISNTLW